jgi:hypothetical protein
MKFIKNDDIEINDIIINPEFTMNLYVEMK